MAFSFSDAVGKDNAGSTAMDGPELNEIETDELGLPGVNGEVKLKLLSQAWSQENLPPPTSSLLAVGSRLGIVAAAGPTELVVTSTEKIRAALLEPYDNKQGASSLRDFEPSARIPRPNLAHIAFTSDESLLVASSQDAGGVDAYRVQDLITSNATPSVQISTEGKVLRALITNPAQDADLSCLVAAVTVDGELLMADVKSGNIRSGSRGTVMQTLVSCVAWSSKGKALVAGLADGTAVQLKPDGTEMAKIPKSTSIPDGYFITTISWLDNDTFMAVYVPQSTDSEGDTLFYIIRREPKTTNFTFDKLPEMLFPSFSIKRSPNHYFVCRLREFRPHLTELVIVSSSSSPDVGMVTKSGKPLSSDNVSAGAFAGTNIADNGRRAALPLRVGTSGDTTPVGMAIDLSSKEPVLNPIPTDPDIIESPHPVPQLLLLNDEGVLSSWWIVYNDSVREKTLYSGMDESSAPQGSVSPPVAPSQAQAQSVPQTNAFAPPTSSFGQPGFGQSVMSKPASSGFGAGQGFGSASSNGPASPAESSFGKSSTIGGAKSSWTSTGFGTPSAPQTSGGAFGQPAFGSASAIGGNKGPAFGTASPLGKPTFGQTAATPSFGSTGFSSSKNAFGSNTSNASPFGAPSGNSQSGFSAFSNKGGFGNLSGKDGEKASSPFGQSSSGGFASFSGNKIQSSASPFGQTPENKQSGFGQGTGFGNASGSGFGVFGKPSVAAGSSNSPFGATGGLKLQSSFKGDGSAKDDLPKPLNGGSGFGFGNNLDDMLGDSQKVTSPTHDKEEEMSEGGASENSEQPANATFSANSPEAKKEPPKTLVTPPSSIGQPKATPAPPVSGLFGEPSEHSTTPQPPPPTSTGWSFGNFPSTTPKEPQAPLPSTTPKETPAATSSIFGQKPQPVPFQFGKKPDPSSPIKSEPESDDESVDLSKIPEAPLPPDTVSKPRYVSGDTSGSSSNSRSTEQSDDAPLPPDWTPANKTATLAPEQSGLPTDEEDDLSEFDASGEEVEDEDDDGSDRPSEGGEDRSEQLQTSPESSFKGGEHSTEASPTGGVFTKVTSTAQKPRPLFGEVGTTGPIFAPPQPQQSPRSPSPVRRLQPTDRLRSEASRSVSAPAHPRSIIDQRKNEYQQSGLARQSVEDQQQELARQRQQQEQLAKSRQEAEALELQNLEDDEDEQIRRELTAPIKPSEILDDFLTYQAKPPEEGVKSGVPAQIERLYRDINSMIDTLGINSRSLASYMMYQQDQEPNENWPEILSSDTPADTLNDDWYLGDIPRLREGLAVLEQAVESAQVRDVDGKVQDCQKILSEDIVDLRTKKISIRRTLEARKNPEANLSAPLTAEQTSIQHDLRKTAVSVQSKLVQLEDALAVLRARLVEAGGSENGKKSGLFGSAGQKKPTVEAVTNTVMKMTKMAKQKSADIDMLESQLRRLDMKGALGGSRNGTPNGTPSQRRSMRASTPGSSSGSTYHTPDSKFGGSTNGTPRTGLSGKMPVISVDDKEKWQAKARRKKEVAAMLKDVLEQRRGTKA